MNFFKILASTILLLQIQTTSSCAEDVYTWTDDQGKIHFSNEPKKDDATKADLPKIEKEDFQEKIKDLKNLTNQTCYNRGGINCEAKQDSDGSVICMDGYKDSAEMYLDLCTEAKLTTELLLPPKRPNKKLSFYPIRVQVRNTTGIQAKEITVKMSLLNHLAEDQRYSLTLEGPSEIEPFGIIEYTYSGKNIEERILRKAHVQVQCKNCWNPSKPIPQGTK